jgi:hypothetical protein
MQHNWLVLPERARSDGLGRLETTWNDNASRYIALEFGVCYEYAIRYSGNIIYVGGLGAVLEFFEQTIRILVNIMKSVRRPK